MLPVSRLGWSALISVAMADTSVGEVTERSVAVAVVQVRTAPSPCIVTQPPAGAARGTRPQTASGDLASGSPIARPVSGSHSPTAPPSPAVATPGGWPGARPGPPHTPRTRPAWPVTGGAGC